MYVPGVAQVTQLRISKRSFKYSRGSPEFPNQNLRQIGYLQFKSYTTYKQIIISNIQISLYNTEKNSSEFSQEIIS